MVKIFIKSILVMVLFLINLTVFAFVYPEKPLGYISDFSHVLSKENVEIINEQLAATKKAYGAQVEIAIFNSLDNQDIDEVANNLFNKWRLGSKEKNDGLLLILDLQEHKVRIEVGYGLEETIPDITANHIIRTDLNPSLKNKKYFDAIQNFINSLNHIFSDKQITHRSIDGQSAGKAPVIDLKGTNKIEPVVESGSNNQIDYEKYSHFIGFLITIGIFGTMLFIATKKEIKRIKNELMNHPENRNPKWTIFKGIIKFYSRINVRAKFNTSYNSNSSSISNSSSNNNKNDNDKFSGGGGSSGGGGANGNF